MADEEKVASPTLDEPSPAPAAEAKPDGNDDVAELMSKLSQIGVEKPEQIDNIFNASQQAGKAWNEVGALRNELAEAKQLLKSVNKPQPEYDEYGEPRRSTKSVRDELREFYMEDILKPQQAAQERVWREQQEIQNDIDFKMMQPIWEKHANSPAFGMKLQSGQTTIKGEYDRLKVNYFREIALKASGVIEKLSLGGKQGKSEVPHMESGQTQSIPNIPEDDEKKERLDKIKKGRESGDLSSDKALDEIIKNILPADDPIFRHER